MTGRAGSGRPPRAGSAARLGRLRRFRRYEVAALDGVHLGYETAGGGEPVVLIHAGLGADWFRPLVEQPALTDRFRLLRYHRVGYGASGHLAGPVSIAAQAEHCRSLLASLGVDRAHVVGHSSGANIALQLALDAPDVVGSLALLETALLDVPSGPFAAEALARHSAGDRAGAVDSWLRGVGGPDYRAALDRAVPGGFDQAVVDVDTFLGQELPALRAWRFTPADAARIGPPALLVLGALSDQIGPAYRARHDLLVGWLPNAEPFVLPAANHLLHVQNPVGMADGLAGFFARHPLSAAAAPHRQHG
jgi:pimeloyl-ACP methyl ester carboxylesterase